jgi:hypothetical protein
VEQVLYMVAVEALAQRQALVDKVLSYLLMKQVRFLNLLF